MRPLQISADTAIKLSKQLNVPIEHLMHMPQHILMQKLAELAKQEAEAKPSEEQSGENN
ncbi:MULTISPECIES: YycC family protein [Saccharibacillus]|uniref:YycC family protein n=1 Tax=Saccharibacillus TaxID=456492 RepID=UPI00123AA234|nr:YycC family protein [Saccharibacillus sp. WB 17]MWJ32439.1 YycC family protein [Saccharibacillus sp. WB 17]